MDIDHFKQVNDTYGHHVGDRVRTTVARTFLNTARPSDLMGRWGGKEFIGILRRTVSTPHSSVSRPWPFAAVCRLCYLLQLY